MKSFNYKEQNLISEEDFYDFLNDLPEVVIRYKDDKISNSVNDLRTGVFKDVFKDTNIETDLESVFVFTLKLIEIIRRKSNQETFFNNIFFFLINI